MGGDDNIAVCCEQAQGRRAAFLRALPKALLDREDSIAASVATKNASARSKLRRIYKLMDEMAVHREGKVACKQGCAACCRMYVTVSALDAEAIAAATGRVAARITESVSHRRTNFSAARTTAEGRSATVAEPRSRHSDTVTAAGGIERLLLPSDRSPGA